MRRQLTHIFFPHLRKRDRRGWRKGLDSLLNRIGPVTRSSPVRRGVQITCLLLFLFAFFVICWPYSENFSSTTFSDQELFKAELFLLIDPLVAISTAIAGRVLHWPTLVWLVGIVGICLLFPRAFCGYLCPLGTLIDLFDGAMGRWFRRLHLPGDAPRGWWVQLKYLLLVSVLVSSCFGILSAGFVSAIPVLTRGMLFTGGRLQIAVQKGSNHLLPVDGTYLLSAGLFLGVFLLSLLGRRFWCRYVCPSGALLSTLHLFRIGQRQVSADCIGCGKCVEICPFDAIHGDYSTRVADCTYCQTCGGVCPTEAIIFATRWHETSREAVGPRSVTTGPLSRRGFLGGLTAGAVAAWFIRSAQPGADTLMRRPVRPPGSVPEDAFLDLCIRCGQCFKVCPGPVLHPAGLEYGIDAMWTPVAHPEHAGCHQDCNFCTQVCPTGAIQPLDIDRKRRVHMGLAKLKDTCLALREDDRKECDLCYLECQQAGYAAIDMEIAALDVDRSLLESQGFSDFEIDQMSQIRVPVVDRDKCVGCGICTYRCFTCYVIQEGELASSAIVIVAENEHRLMQFQSL